MYDIPFVRFAAPCAILYLFFYFLIVNPPMDQTDSANQIPPEEAQALRQKGLRLMEAKQFEDALEPLTKLHLASPDSHIYHHDLAEVFHALGNYEEEVKMWELYMVHSPVPGDGCPQISEAYRALGKLDEVMKSTKRCFDFEPTNADMIFFYAHELERRGQTAQARQLYEKGRALAPNYPDINVGLARTRSASGQDAEAKKLVDEVLKTRPDNVDALVAAGLIYARMGQRAPAIQFLRHARVLAPAYREVETLLAGVMRNRYVRQMQ